MLIITNIKRNRRITLSTSILRWTNRPGILIMKANIDHQILIYYSYISYIFYI